MADYIERKAALLMLTYHPLTDPDPLDLIPAVLRTARKAVAKIPAADVVEVVHGRWIKHLDFWRKCSECGASWHEQWVLSKALNYCPNCGARMDGE